MNKKEEQLRDFIKLQILEVLKEGEEPTEEPIEEPAEEEEEEEEEPIEEPIEEPEEEPEEEEEEGLAEELAEITAGYIKKLKHSSSDVDEAGVAEMAATLIDGWGYGSSSKLAILQAIKQALYTLMIMRIILN